MSNAYRQLDARVDDLLRRHAMVGIAVGVVENGELSHVRTRGCADLESRSPVSEDTVFRIASMTKTFTAVAIMQLVEQGRLDLDLPAENYLRSFRLERVRPGAPPATLRHLLTHTAGVPEVIRPSALLRRLFGETVPIGRPVPSLADYYRGSLKTYAEPGTRFAYSDHNFTVLGQIVEDVSRQPLADYLRAHVFDVLDMASTDLIRSERIRARLARGYALGRRGARPVPDYELVTRAAGGAYSTLADMATYAAALLDGGANDHGRILAEATVTSMFAPQYRPDARLPGIGLSFWRGEVDGRAIVDHGGILPGFNSQMFLAPDDRSAVLSFTNGARAAMLWLPGETSALLGELIGAREPGANPAGPQRPETWAELCGWYKLRARLTDLRAREMAGLGVEVFVRRGQLMLRLITPIPVLCRGLPLLSDRDDPYAFWLDLRQFDIGVARVVFAGQPGTGAVHFDLLPMSADKGSEACNPRRLVTAAGIVTGAAVVGTACHRRRSRPRTA